MKLIKKIVIVIICYTLSISIAPISLFAGHILLEDACNNVRAANINKTLENFIITKLTQAADLENLTIDQNKAQSILNTYLPYHNTTSWWNPLKYIRSAVYVVKNNVNAAWNWLIAPEQNPPYETRSYTTLTRQQQSTPAETTPAQQLLIAHPLQKQSIQQSPDELLAQTLQEQENIQKNQIEEDALLAHAIANSFQEIEVALKPSMLPAGRGIPLTTKQIEVINQEGATCGVHAMCNALATHPLYNLNKPITEENIKEMNTHYYVRCLNHYDTLKKQSAYYRELTIQNIEPWDMLPILHEMHKVNETDPLYCYYIKYNYGNSFTPAGSNITNPYDFTTLEDSIANIKHRNKGIVHIICNTGGHWVEASIIKKSNEPFNIMYCNSTNLPLASDGTAQQFLAYLEQKLQNS